MNIVGKTDIGRVRSENQDCFCMGELSTTEGFALVCDGMGGAQGGGTASATACRIMQQYLLRAPMLCHCGMEKSFLTQAMENANLAIFCTAAKDPDLAGMGTTAVCVVVQDGQAFISHVGDSRAYLLRGDAFTQLTKDHSYVQELLDEGVITQEEAEQHPHRSTITRALGVEHRVEPDFTALTIVAGDILLLCSDGLSKLLPDDTIARIMQQEPFETLPERLIAAANQMGGTDNITVVLLTIQTAEGQHG